MRVPFEWLCELASVSVPVDEVARRLTDAGFEVAEIHRASEHWDRVVVGEVVRIDPHPNADRLNLPTVTTGGRGAPGGVRRVELRGWRQDRLRA